MTRKKTVTSESQAGQKLTHSDSDDDDAAALMAELAKIKQERAEEKARIVSVDTLSD